MGSFTYEGEICSGKITEINTKEVTISAMQRSLKSWKWPVPEDLHTYSWEDVIGGISVPKHVSKRGFYEILEMKSVWNW